MITFDTSMYFLRGGVFMQMVTFNLGKFINVAGSKVKFFIFSLD